MYSFQLTNNILAIISIIIIGYFLPWWTFSIFTCIIGYISKTEKSAIINGFIVGFIPWFILLLYAYYNDGMLLFTKMSSLLSMEIPMILIILSSTLSGIIGTITAWTGWQFNKRG
ncbi:MAG: hypothetical protein CMG24_02915 [Candidatus Marinimicrobia bacterium]|nr:hypothetical protein [Candidatus Neomarinimicrobiota bacterium]|tara:strand:+ start:1165 stop:1509 length:345 start_codon:yes stop_codon:yes gene_type:complete